MREYKILTDSTTDLSPQLVAQTGVTVLPMTYTIGEKSYRNDPEETELSSGDFTICSAARGYVHHQPDQCGDIPEVAGKWRGTASTCCMGFSSGLSGTFNSARIAFEDLSAEYPSTNSSRWTAWPPPWARACWSTMRRAAEGGPQH